VYFILDVDAAVTLLQMSTTAVQADGIDGPPEATLVQWAAQARKSFVEAFLRRVTVPPLSPSTTSIAGLAFRDPHPPNITHHGNFNVPPSAQVEAASGMAAMDRALNDNATTRGALAEMLAGLLLNVSAGNAVSVGGVIDMAHLGRSLVSYGRPDAAFALLSANGSTSLYSMANSTGTLWAHPGGADGYRGRCSSHNHIMMGGSVGEALYGIGGIQPSFLREAVPDFDGVTERL